MTELLPMILEPLDDSAVLGSDGFISLEPLALNLVTSNNPVTEADELLACLEDCSDGSPDFDLPDYTGRGRSQRQKSRSGFANIVIKSFETRERCRISVPVFDRRNGSGRHNEDKVTINVIRTASLAACERGPRDSTDFTIWIGRKIPYNQTDLSTLLAEASAHIARERRIVERRDEVTISQEILAALESALAVHLRGKRTTQTCFLHFPCRTEFIHLVHDLTEQVLNRQGPLPFELLARLLASPRYRAPRRSAGVHSTTAYTKEDLAILRLLTQADLKDQSIVLHDIHPTVVHRRVCRLVSLGVLRWKVRPRGKVKSAFTVAPSSRKELDEAAEEEVFMRYRDYNRFRAAEAVGGWEEITFGRVEFPAPDTLTIFGLDEIVHKVEVVDYVG